jgi:hypothetical protein
VELFHRSDNNSWHKLTTNGKHKSYHKVSHILKNNTKDFKVTWYEMYNKNNMAQLNCIFFQSPNICTHLWHSWCYFINSFSVSLITKLWIIFWIIYVIKSSFYSVDFIWNDLNLQAVHILFVPYHITDSMFHWTMYSNWTKLQLNYIWVHLPTAVIVLTLYW